MPAGQPSSMLIKTPQDIPSREITPRDVYVNRRLFMKTAVMAGSVAATGGVYRWLNSPPVKLKSHERLANIVSPGTTQPSPDGLAYDDKLVRAFRVEGENQTPLEDITNYNNFYEFS